MRLVYIFLFIFAGLFINVSAYSEDYKIGAVMYAEPFYEGLEGLKNGLESYGVEAEYIVKNINGDIDMLDEVYADFMAAKVDLIFTTTTPVAVRMKELNEGRVPILFNEVADPVGSGIVKMMNKPGGNITGVSHLAFIMLSKRVAIFKQCFPQIEELVIFSDPEVEFTGDQLKYIRPAAKQLGLSLNIIKVSSSEDIKEKASKLKLPENSGIFMAADPITAGNISSLIRLSRKEKTPLMVIDNFFLRLGGTIGYSPSFYGVGLQSAQSAKLILNGTNAGNIPVQFPDSVELAINKKEIDFMGIGLNKECLEIADTIIK